jgi:hypothetical protein
LLQKGGNFFKAPVGFVVSVVFVLSVMFVMPVVPVVMPFPILRRFSPRTDDLHSKAGDSPAGFPAKLQAKAGEVELVYDPVKKILPQPQIAEGGQVHIPGDAGKGFVEKNIPGRGGMGFCIGKRDHG